MRLYGKRTFEGFRMRIGIFGGSFDPIHNEHISLAKQAITDLGLDKLFIIPAANPPHKPWRVLTSDEHRLELCHLAFDGEEKIEVSDYEIAAGGTSYTYLTLRHFRELYPEAEFYLLVGTDMLRNFPLWKYPEEILENCTLAVCARAEEAGWATREQTEFFNRFGRNFVVLSYEGKDVSSTKIRVLAGAGLEITHYTDENCAAYIEENGLYKVKGGAKALSLQKPNRQAHTLRVALLAAERATGLPISEKKAVQACLLHDCAKNLRLDDPLLKGFVAPEDCPPAVVHQYAGEYVARTALGVDDEEVLSAVACHTSGKENMSLLDKLVFLSDLVEEERSYSGVENLRRLFWEDIDKCLLQALEDTVEYLERSGQPVYERTIAALRYHRIQCNKEK